MKVNNREIPWSHVSQRDNYSIGLCMSFHELMPLLDEQTLEHLVREIFPMAARAFSISQSNEFYEDVREHITVADMLAVCFSNHQVIGFASVRDMVELDTFFLYGVAVEPTTQCLGVASILISSLLEKSPRRRIAFTTQNPKMFCLLKKYARKCFPSPDEQNVHHGEMVYGAKLMSKRHGEFDPSTFVSKNLYQNCLYPEIQPAADAKVNQWFWRSLEIQDGRTRHGFLLCGER